jgi:hypothetical protein
MMQHARVLPTPSFRFDSLAVAIVVANVVVVVVVAIVVVSLLSSVEFERHNWNEE